MDACLDGRPRQHAVASPQQQVGRRELTQGGTNARGGPRAARLQAAAELRRSPRRAEVGRSFFGYLALQRAHDRKRCTVGGLAGVDLLRTLLCCARCGELAVRNRDAGARNTLA